MTLPHWIPRSPLTAYFVLAYAITWGSTLGLLTLRRLNLSALTQQDLVAIFAFMILGPSTSGLAMTALLEGRAGLHALVVRLKRWRVGLRWYVMALGVVPALLLPILWSLAAMVDPVYAPRFQWVLFGIGLVAGCFEEIGWTGFATPRLLQGASFWRAGLSLGLLWALWHLMADLAGNLQAMGWYWLAWFGVFWVATLPAYRLLMTWVFAHTGSLLIAILMHAGYTGWLFVLIPATSFGQSLIWQVLFAASLWVVAAITMIIGGGAPSQRLQKR